MNTFLFAWNPKVWNWDHLDTLIDTSKKGIPIYQEWRVFSHKKISAGDRFYLMRLGSHPKGIIGSGRVVSNAFLSVINNISLEEKYYVKLEFDTLLHQSEILPVKLLDPGFNWFIQASGIEIPHPIALNLAQLWLNYERKIIEPSINNTRYQEGSIKEFQSKKYERNLYARKECIKKYGYKCHICEFDFKEVYGEIGENYIEVHHRYPISLKNGQTYNLDPHTDLIPVCANCHRMLHRKKATLDVEELRKTIKSITKT